MFKVLYFGASWCGQCKVLKPKFIAECERLGMVEDCDYEIIDAEEREDLALKFGVRNIPALVCLNGNKVTGRATGLDAWQRVEGWRNAAAQEAENGEYEYGHNA